MQRVLSCNAKDRKPPFSLSGLTIPERDKLRMRIESRNAVSFSWDESKRIAEAVRKLYRLDDSRKNAYATAFLLAAAYRTVVLTDAEGCEALRALKQYSGDATPNPNVLVFHSRRGTPLRETNVLADGLHPALAALGLLTDCDQKQFEVVA